MRRGEELQKGEELFAVQGEVTRSPFLPINKILRAPLARPVTTKLTI